MILIDLKLPKKSKKEKELAEIPIAVEEDRYPWGTRLEFEDQLVEKIKILKSVKAGDMVNIQAKAKVIGLRINDREKSGEKRNVELQIQKIGISNKAFEEKEAEEAFKEGAA